MPSDILLVDDTPERTQTMGHLLSGVALLRVATSGAAALQQARDDPPDLLVLDADLPGMSGHDVCQAMKADPALRDIPVILVTGHSAPEFERRGLDIGVADFVTRPINAPQLLGRVRTQLRVKALTDQLRRIATVDTLTGVANRRSFDDALDDAWRHGLRASDPISLLLIEVDHFERFIAHHGRAAGDACLRTLAHGLRSNCLRPGDTLARHGAAALALLLPQTGWPVAERLARRMLAQIDARCRHPADTQTLPQFTACLGGSAYDPASAAWAVPATAAQSRNERFPTAADLLRSAEQALAGARRSGPAQAWWLDLCHVDDPTQAGPWFDPPARPQH
jgi:diguanylate cyclase (GGDEF)-like protein